MNQNEDDDAVSILNENYLTSPHPKLRASGLIFAAQKILRQSPSPNYEEAFSLFKKALDSWDKNPIALYNMGVHYYLGKGVTMNHKKAVNFFKKAAYLNRFLYGCRNFGVAEASYALGKCFEEGHGLPKNYRKAGEWYYESHRSDNGYGPAAVVYGNFCRDGLIDGHKDLELAQQFWNLAASRGMSSSSIPPSIDFLLKFENPMPMIVCQDATSSRYWAQEREIREKAEILPGGHASNLCHALTSFAQALAALSSYLDADPSHAHRERVAQVEQEIIHHVAASFRWTMEDVAICEQDIWDKFLQFVDTHVSSTTTKSSNLDRDARICKLVKMKSNLMKSARPHEALANFLQFLKQSKAKYENEIYFHRLAFYMGSIHETNFGPGAGLDLESTMKLFPDHPDLLFLKAVILQNRTVARGRGQGDIDDACLLRFLEKAPRDHKNVPEAYYRLAQSCSKRGDRDHMIRYYGEGLAAEKSILSCHLPFECSQKNVVQHLVKGTA